MQSCAPTMIRVITLCFFSFLLFPQVTSWIESPFHFMNYIDAKNQYYTNWISQLKEIPQFNNRLSNFLETTNSHFQQENYNPFANDANKSLDNVNITNGKFRRKYFNNLTLCINKTLIEIKTGIVSQISSNLDAIKSYKCKENPCYLVDGLTLIAMRNNLTNKLNKLEKQYVKKLRIFERQIYYCCQHAQDILFKMLGTVINITAPQNDRHDDESFLSQLNRTDKINRKLETFFNDVEVNFEKKYSALYNSALENVTSKNIGRQQSPIFNDYYKNLTSCTTEKITEIKANFTSEISVIHDSIKNYECRKTWCSNIDGLILEIMNNEFENKIKELKKQYGTVLSGIQTELTNCSTELSKCTR